MSNVKVILPSIVRNAPRKVIIRVYTTGAPHALAIHEGRTPGARGPSASMLEEWCQRKLGNKKLAFVVARAIKKKGFSPAHHGGDTSGPQGSAAAKFFTRTMKENRPGWLRAYVSAVVDKKMKAEDAGFRVGSEWQAEAVTHLNTYWKPRSAQLINSIKVDVKGG